MNILYASILLVSLGLIVVSIIPMLFRRFRRRAAVVFGVSTVAFVASIILYEPNQEHKAAVASQAEPITSKAETIASSTPFPRIAKAKPPASTPVGSPGVARICLTDSDVHLGAEDEIVIPATTVFKDNGPNVGKSEDPTTWRYEVKEGFGFPAKFSTLSAVSLRNAKLCGEAKVQMLTDAGATETTRRASDRHIFVIDDVLDYPIPSKRPAIEIGKLIDDISVEALLITDVTQAIARPASAVGDAASCLASAKQLAAYLGTGTGRQTTSNVELGPLGGATVLYGCPVGHSIKPDIEVYWQGQARPAPNTMAVIAKGGEYITGASQAEIKIETSACATDALKPSAGEIADRQVRGVKIECQAFARDGGGGSVTIYRRFGPDMARPTPSAEAMLAVDRASREMKIEGDRKAAEARHFAEWYQDPSIPKNVKSFAMMAARVMWLEQRCPSSKSHAAEIAQWANDAGVTPADIGPSGRYNSLMNLMLEQMQASNESSAAACEVLRKNYD